MAWLRMLQRVSGRSDDKGIEVLHVGVGALGGGKDGPALVRVARALVPDDRGTIGDVACGVRDELSMRTLAIGKYTAYCRSGP